MIVYLATKADFRADILSNRIDEKILDSFQGALRKSKANFISKLGTAGEEADECKFWLEMFRDIATLRNSTFEL